MSTCYILGAGLTGLTVASRFTEEFENVVAFEKNDYIGGLCQTRRLEQINYEFGPHVLYAKTRTQQAFWESYLDNQLIDYRVRCCVNGKLGTYDELYDFPISRRNLKRLGVAHQATAPDYSNFENYMISQIGRRGYDTFVKNYNIKQWGLDPKEMSAEWARFRPLTLKDDNPKMFGDLWAGHPGSYEPLFEKLAQNVTIRTNHAVSAMVNADGTIRALEVRNGQVDPKTGTPVRKRIELGPEDLIVNTLPLDLFFPTDLTWRGVIKVFTALDREGVMPSYSTTFPNHYPWTRVLEYPRHSGQPVEGKTLLSFAIPFGDHRPSLEEVMAQINRFIKNEIGANIIARSVESERRVYPVSSKANLTNLTKLFRQAAKLKNFLTVGRLGLFAYISMARAVEMALELVDNRTGLQSEQDRYDFYQHLREELW